MGIFLTPQDCQNMEVDTLLAVHSEMSSTWLLRYFAKVTDSSIFCWRQGATSLSAEGKFVWRDVVLPNNDNFKIRCWHIEKPEESVDYDFSIATIKELNAASEIEWKLILR